MRVNEEEWQKTWLPFLWKRFVYVWAGEDRDGRGGYVFDAWLEYRVSIRKPCNHEWAERELFGDERLQWDDRYLRVCDHCRKIETHS